MTDETTGQDSVLEDDPLAETGADLADSGTDQDDVMISDLDLAPAIEAVLMVVDEPVGTVTLAQVLRRPEGQRCRSFCTSNMPTRPHCMCPSASCI